MRKLVVNMKGENIDIFSLLKSKTNAVLIKNNHNGHCMPLNYSVFILIINYYETYKTI